MDEPAEPAAVTTSLDTSLDEMAGATDRLLRTVDGLTDADLRGPSLLPGWTRAHVLAHVARNADGLVNLVETARTGEERPMYAGGREGRDADIETGAGRHVGDVRLDLAESAERLLEAFADFPEDGLGREVALPSGASAYGWEIPLLRVREVEIHHVDVGLGYTPDDWTLEFAERTLDQLAPLFRDARDCPVGVLAATDSEGRWEVASAGTQLSGSPLSETPLSETRLSGPRTALLAWLTGRTAGEGLDISPAGAVPPAPRWT